ncbi:MAG: GSCFA domain-containing protein [Tateyamaria sp.]|uniref:GSCFA domain-containing protein n=1 Tax=Tateyamaria sp. TaxID=1929288 RepID=UPI003276465D
MSHPYESLPPDRFWRSAVAERSPFQIEGLWQPRFQIKKRARIITAGSCFAQHIARALVARGYNWLDGEPAPEGMTDAAKRDYNYGTFSFRTGNIYTPNMLRQWLSWAAGTQEPPQVTWEKDGRYYDPFRPAVELNGFSSEDELYDSRHVTIAAIRTAIEYSGFFVFTLGLTEAWIDRVGGYEFAICPGTVAGVFDAEQHEFVNYGFQSTFRNLQIAISLARKINRHVKFILTVSPVPLTATATDEHVLTATSHSKSILRAVAGEMKTANPAVDYFPSYEIITHPAFRGMFFGPNMRSVDAKGVEFVMDSFFRDQFNAFSKTVTVERPYGVIEQKVVGPEQALPKRAIPASEAAEAAAEEVLCEEEMLDAFSK